MKVSLKFFGVPLIGFEFESSDESSSKSQNGGETAEDSSVELPSDSEEEETRIQKVVDWLLDTGLEEGGEKTPARSFPAEDRRRPSIRDGSTGLFNRRYFEEVIDTELARAKRYGHPIGFLLADLKGFEEVSQELTSAEADRVLRETAQLLLDNTRNSDTVIRYGGHEFLIMLAETNGETDCVKQRIQEAADRWQWDTPEARSLSLAVGGAHWSPDGGADFEDVLAQADRDKSS